MGFYERAVFPMLMDLAMRAPVFPALRSEVLAMARGRVLEIGFGTGLNLRHYPAGGITGIFAVDPNPGMSTRAERRVRASKIPVERVLVGGESIAVADASFDTAVSTFTLCSIPEAGRALAEVRRALVPGGALLVLEHGLSPEPRVARWQKRLTPIQKVIACGCHLDRDMRALVEGAGFAFDAVRSFYVTGAPKFAGYLTIGSARKK